MESYWETLLPTIEHKLSVYCGVSESTNLPKPVPSVCTCNAFTTKSILLFQKAKVEFLKCNIIYYDQNYVPWYSITNIYWSDPRYQEY